MIENLLQLWRRASAPQKNEILYWWNSLSISVQRELFLLWNPPATFPEKTRLVGMYIDADEESLMREGRIDYLAENRRKIPAVLSVFEANRADHALAFWELFEFVSNNELEFGLKLRHFHVCQAHPNAREALCRGLIPASFSCPLQEKTCPMRDILDASPGKSVRLFLC